MDFWIDGEAPGDAEARERLVAACLGRARTGSAMLREGNVPCVALVARTFGLPVAGTVRLWPIAIGNGRSAAMLGPLAVSPELRGLGAGTALVAAALGEARRDGVAAAVLVGDPAWYARLGFAPLAGLAMPGPSSPGRALLALALAGGGLDGARGTVSAARPVPMAA